MEKPTEDYSPYKDRKEHDYVNEMHVVLTKADLVIRDATQIVNRLRAIVDEHIEVTKQIRSNDNETTIS